MPREPVWSGKRARSALICSRKMSAIHQLCLDRGDSSRSPTLIPSRRQGLASSPLPPRRYGELRGEAVEHDRLDTCSGRRDAVVAETDVLYRFGGFTVNVATRLLLSDEGEVLLSPKA